MSYEEKHDLICEKDGVKVIILYGPYDDYSDSTALNKAIEAIQEDSQ